MSWVEDLSVRDQESAVRGKRSWGLKKKTFQGRWNQNFNRILILLTDYREWQKMIIQTDFTSALTLIFILSMFFFSLNQIIFLWIRVKQSKKNIQVWLSVNFPICLTMQAILYFPATYLMWYCASSTIYLPVYNHLRFCGIIIISKNNLRKRVTALARIFMIISLHIDADKTQF